MWAISDLAWWFEWAAGRFQEAADACRNFSFWIGYWQIRPLLWLEPHLRGLVIFCYEARDKVRAFDAWIDGQLANLRLDLYYFKEGIRLEIEWRVRQAVDLLLGGAEWLRQKAEDAWNKANELWGIVYSNIKPRLDYLSDKFWQLKGWVENTALPEIRLTLYYLKEDLLLQVRVLTGWWGELRQRLDELNPFRESWKFLQDHFKDIAYTFTTGWANLKMFLAEPEDTIWAFLEKTLLKRVEQFLNERWDTRP